MTQVILKCILRVYLLIIYPIMATQYVGLKEFKAKINDYAAKVQKKNARFVVMKKNKPLFEVTPLNDEAYYSEEFRKGIKRALADVKAGRVYSSEEVRKYLGIK